MSGGEVDYAPRPAEDFARAAVTLRAPEGEQVLVEATTSWSFVGPALRLRAELLGPEYSMQVDSLTTDLTVFLGREVSGDAGEDLVEKQNAEQGLMPVIADEAGAYGYTAENRHMVQAFLDGRDAGRDVARRPRRHRGADGVLPLRRARHHRALSGAGVGDVHPGRGARRMARVALWRPNRNRKGAKGAKDAKTQLRGGYLTHPLYPLRPLLPCPFAVPVEPVD